MEILPLDFITEIPLGPWLMAFSILLGSLIVKWAWDRFVHRVLRRIVEHTKMTYDDMLLEAILRPTAALIYASGFYLAVLVLPLPKEPWNLPVFFQDAWEVTFLLIIVWLAYRLCDPLTAFFQGVMAKNDENVAKQFAPMIRQALRFVIVMLAAVLVIQNLGYKVTSLLTGMGIGGLAVALAAQDTLANVFGTLVMLTDRPFRVGDWVYVDGVEGTVESLGFRSTRVRTWSKSLIVVPNKLLTERHIENWSAMPKRRVKMTLGLTYNTPPAKVAAFVEQVKELLITDDAVDQDFHMVNFTTFGTSSLEIMLYYFTCTTVWATYLAERQRINLLIMGIAQDLGISFAFPSQTQYFGDPLHIIHEHTDGHEHTAGRDHASIS